MDCMRKYKLYLLCHTTFSTSNPQLPLFHNWKSKTTLHHIQQKWNDPTEATDKMPECFRVIQSPKGHTINPNRKNLSYHERYSNLPTSSQMAGKRQLFTARNTRSQTKRKQTPCTAAMLHAGKTPSRNDNIANAWQSQHYTATHPWRLFQLRVPFWRETPAVIFPLSNAATLPCVKAASEISLDRPSRE